MKTVLITGASSGIGKAAVILFARKGWSVAATMRKPELESDLKKFENVFVTRLDVNDSISIREAVDMAIGKFGRIDVIVNNAGYGTLGPFEAANAEQVERHFGVNVFGLMNVTREILPLFRKQKSGTIINVASVAGHLSFPSFSLYNATKFAVIGFSDALFHELRPYNIRVKVVEPGPIKTDFYNRSLEKLEKPEIEGQYAHVQKAMKKIEKMGMKGLPPERVAKTIFRAAESASCRIHYPVGIQTSLMIKAGKILPHSWLNAAIRLVLR